MAKKFQLVDTFEQRTPTTPPETNWKLCLVCQELTTESLVCPVLSKCRDPGSGYTTMAANLVRFDELGKLPITVQLHRLDEGQSVEATMVAHQDKWHKTCMLQYNNTMLRRAEKRPIASSSAFGSSDDVPGKRTRSLSSEATTSDASCFFCGESGTETLHGVATYQVDTRVRKCAAQVGDNELLARLSMSDMVALEAKYHSKCLLALYYRAKTTVEAEPKTDHAKIGFSQRSHIDQSGQLRCQDCCPVLKLRITLFSLTAPVFEASRVLIICSIGGAIPAIGTPLEYVQGSRCDLVCSSGACDVSCSKK